MTHHDQHPPGGDTHVVGYASSILIWVGLVSLTGITVALAGIDLGRWVIATALIIASIKTVLVLNVFMHLKFEDRIFRVFALVAAATLAIFFVMTFFDYAFH
jgi:cytochrome c oxidase subunit IV